jgi:hypothetical protein
MLDEFKLSNSKVGSAGKLVVLDVNKGYPELIGKIDFALINDF